MNGVQEQKPSFSPALASRNKIALGFLRFDGSFPVPAAKSPISFHLLPLHNVSYGINPLIISVL
jgi:hypothetical protein